MNILDRLETRHSRANTVAIADYVGGDAKRLQVLIDIFLHGEKRISQRAAWPLSYVAKAYPGIFEKHLGKLLKKLVQPGEHDAVRRNILRALAEMQIPEKFEGAVVDACFRFLRAASEPIAVRAFAITVAAQVCKKYPELSDELRLMLFEIRSQPMPAAISVRIKRALKQIQEQVRSA